MVNEAVNASGDALDSRSRALMERSFGQDFSQVRVHTDSRAAKSAVSVNALAYTVGGHIAFGPNQYAPGTPRGDRLMAHELAHVVQQKNAPPKLQSFGIHTPDSALHLEREADRAAERTMSGRDVGPLSQVSTVSTLQRKEDSAKDSDPDDSDDDDDADTEPAEAKGAHGCIQELEGQDPASVLRLDTVTVIEVGGNHCKGCDEMSQELNDICQDLAGKQEKIKFRVFSINVDRKADKRRVNKKIFKRIKAQTGLSSIPQTFVYTEHQQSAFYSGHDNTVDYRAQIGAIFRRAGSKGVFKGMNYGAIAGSVAGGLAGSIAGGILGAKGGGSNAFLGVLLGGLAGSAAGAAVGIGLGSLLGAAFSKDKGRAVLSPERVNEVREYVFGKRDKDGKLVEAGIHQNKRIRGDSSADDLARDAVDYWIDHRDTFPLDEVDRRFLILEMLDGVLSRDDQRGIIKILENSSDADILRIMNGVGVTQGEDREETVSFADLQTRFSGTELSDVNGILDRMRDRFPVDAPLGKTQGLWIDRAAVRSEMKGGYEAARKEPRRSEVAGAFLDSGNPDSPLIYRRVFPGTRSQMNVAADEARDKFGKNKAIVASYHTHPVEVATIGRLAPSSADLTSPVDNKRNFGDEHYVINPFTTHLVTTKGNLIQLGNTDALLGTERPPVPKGVRSTLEDVQ